MLITTHLPPFAIQVGIAVAALGICYAAVIASLIDVWSTNYLYSYGFAVPIIAAYIAWTKAQQSRMPEPAPDYLLGVPVTLVAVAMLRVGQAGGVMTLEQVSLVVALVGLLLLVFGRSTLRYQWFAVAYLLMMVPIWGYPIEQLQDPSRTLSATIAANLLDLAGLPNYRQDTNIILPSVTLAVLRECSGVNQLIALAAMVVPAAYLWLRTNAQRAALIAFAIVTSYLCNGLRIAVVGLLAAKGIGNGDLLHGPYHVAQGLGISLLGYLAIGACFSLLSAMAPPAPPQSGDSAGTSRGPMPATRRRTWLDAVLVCLMVSAGAARLSATPQDLLLSENLSSLESQIGAWTMESANTANAFSGIDDELVRALPSPEGSRRFSGFDEELIRTYRSSSGVRLQLYLAYYRSQSQGRELAGDASSVLDAAASPVLLQGPEPLELREVVREQAQSSRGVLFWYDINGRIVSDIYRAKGYTIWDALTRRRTNGAVVMIAWDGVAGEKAETARREAIEFAQALIPVLRSQLPS